MSDPTARRGDNITALLDHMVAKNSGWSKRMMSSFLAKRYRGGVRRQTIDGIIQDCIDWGWITGKSKSGARNILFYYATGEHNKK